MSAIGDFIRGLWIGGVLLAAAPAAFLCLMALAAGRASPRLDVFTHLAAIWLLAGLVTLATSFLAVGVIRWSLLAVGSAAALGALALMAPEYLRDVGPQAPDYQGEALKIIQFNGFRYNSKVNQVVDWLIEEKPDIVTIQETRPDLRAEILRRTGWQVAGLPAGNLTIFSAKPRLEMNRPSNQGRLHWVNATYPGPGGPYEVVTVHLDWPNSRWFAGQRRQLIDMIRQRPHERLILTGDFNATPWSHGLREIDRQGGVIRRERALFSYPAGGDAWDPISLPVPILPLDHVYAGPGWATVSVKRGPRMGSDHYPVIVVLAPR